MNWLQENWIFIVTILTSFISGGLAGHLYSQYKVDKRNAKQKIKIQSLINKIFKVSELIDSKIAITESNKTYQFDNLYLVKIIIQNSGNVAFQEFDLGVKLNSEFKIFKSNYSSIGSKHELIFVGSEPKIEKPVSELDVVLNPFNREDEYTLDLQVFSEKGIDFSEKLIEFSTKKDVIINSNSVQNSKNDDIPQFISDTKIRVNLLFLIASIIAVVTMSYSIFDSYANIKNSIDSTHQNLDHIGESFDDVTKKIIKDNETLSRKIIELEKKIISIEKKKNGD
jgi:hypothetical protein